MPEVILLVALFSILLFLPFVPSLIELFLKRDAKPIPIDLERKKEPDYFGKSFINLLATALKDLKIQEVKKFNPVYLKLKLNREEWVGFLNDEKLAEDTMDTPVIFTKDTVFFAKSYIQKRISCFWECCVQKYMCCKKFVCKGRLCYRSTRSYCKMGACRRNSYHKV